MSLTKSERKARTERVVSAIREQGPLSNTQMRAVLRCHGEHLFSNIEGLVALGVIVEITGARNAMQRRYDLADSFGRDEALVSVADEDRSIVVTQVTHEPRSLEWLADEALAKGIDETRAILSALATEGVLRLRADGLWEPGGRSLERVVAWVRRGDIPRTHLARVACIPQDSIAKAAAEWCEDGWISACTGGAYTMGPRAIRKAAARQEAAE